MWSNKRPKVMTGMKYNKLFVATRQMESPFFQRCAGAPQQRH
jgi:hypothetical protein